MDKLRHASQKQRDVIDQLEKADLFRVPEVDDLSSKAVIRGEAVDTLHQVVDEAETPRLLTVAVHRQGSAR